MSRQAEARRNDTLVFDAARAVLAELGPDASMAAIARRAGVGVASLYRRYASKDELVQQLCIHAMEQLVELAQQAVEQPGDAWAAFTGFMRDCAEAGSGELLQLAGVFPATDEQLATSDRLAEVLEALLDRAIASGAMRAGITPGDLYLIFAQLRVRGVGSAERSALLQRRYLELMLDGLRATGHQQPPGPAPSWLEVKRCWRPEL
ncbi:TetR/AcrR family transcriptional regulator [Kutzneria viridogrisea]|uniref:AcrR family transcriptional regulator n=1 Tax=Kutzneria viridogrisea TaxID=47990 RepID=A0ABR6BNV8_9PSEU|nr:AcrR family transcriptional regulator [Kutzneria viridogrisea]